MCTHLTQRNGTYYYRRKVPADLVQTFGKEVVFSLKTKDREAAKVLVHKWDVHYDVKFLSALTPLKETSEAPSPVAPPARTFPPKLYESLTIDDAETYTFLFNKRLRVLRESARANNKWSTFMDYLDKLISDAEEYLRTGEHPFEDNPLPMWKLEAQLKAANSLRNNTTIPFTDSMFKASKEVVTTVTTITDDSLTDLINKWASERTPRPRTVDKMKRVIIRFQETVGRLAITSIKKTHAVAFKDALLGAGFTAANTNQYLTELSTLLSFAVSQAIIDVNPATGIKIKTSESARDSRHPFDHVALKAVFNSPIYTNNHRPLGGKGEAAYWLPLLALYTGARLDELCQLHVSDIRQETYQDVHDTSHTIWVLRITDEGVGQKLKNSGSRRRVPIHQALLNLGFIEYVQAQTSIQVFPELKPASAYGSLSGNWSKWFGKYLREKIKVIDTKMVFHSFRHNFKDYARNAGIATEVHNALTGHSGGDVAANYGSDKYPLRPLAEAMNKYKVSGIVLPAPAIRS